MASIRDQILANICTVLSAEGTPATGGVFRSIAETLSAGRFPAFAVQPVREPIQRGDRGSVFRSLQVRVAAVTGVAYDETTTIDTQIDPLLTWAEKQILADPRQNNLALDTQITEISWEIEGSDLMYCGSPMAFEVIYSTAEGNPEERT